jgi:hypothetical protein
MIIQLFLAHPAVSDPLRLILLICLPRNFDAYLQVEGQLGGKAQIPATPFTKKLLSAKPKSSWDRLKV